MFFTNTHNSSGTSLFLDCVLTLKSRSPVIRAELHVNDPEVCEGVASISSEGPVAFLYPSIYEDTSTVNRPSLQCLLQVVLLALKALVLMLRGYYCTTQEITKNNSLGVQIGYKQLSNAIFLLFFNLFFTILSLYPSWSTLQQFFMSVLPILSLYPSWSTLQQFFMSFLPPLQKDIPTTTTHTPVRPPHSLGSKVSPGLGTSSLTEAIPGIIWLYMCLGPQIS